MQDVRNWHHDLANRVAGISAPIADPDANVLKMAAEQSPKVRGQKKRRRSSLGLAAEMAASLAASGSPTPLSRDGSTPHLLGLASLGSMRPGASVDGSAAADSIGAVGSVAKASSGGGPTDEAHSGRPQAFRKVLPGTSKEAILASPTARASAMDTADQDGPSGPRRRRRSSVSAVRAPADFKRVDRDQLQTWADETKKAQQAAMKAAQAVVEAEATAKRVQDLEAKRDTAAEADSGASSSRSALPTQEDAKEVEVARQDAQLAREHAQAAAQEARQASNRLTEMSKDEGADEEQKEQAQLAAQVASVAARRASRAAGDVRQAMRAVLGQDKGMSPLKRRLSMRVKQKAAAKKLAVSPLLGPADIADLETVDELGNDKLAPPGMRQRSVSSSSSTVGGGGRRSRSESTAVSEHRAEMQRAAE